MYNYIYKQSKLRLATITIEHKSQTVSDKGFFCSVKSYNNLLCINFASILSILGRREMAL